MAETGPVPLLEGDLFPAPSNDAKIVADAAGTFDDWWAPLAALLGLGDAQAKLVPATQQAFAGLRPVAAGVDQAAVQSPVPAEASSYAATFGTVNYTTALEVGAPLHPGALLAPDPHAGVQQAYDGQANGFLQQLAQLLNAWSVIP